MLHDCENRRARSERYLIIQISATGERRTNKLRLNVLKYLQVASQTCRNHVEQFSHKFVVLKTTNLHPIRRDFFFLMDMQVCKRKQPADKACQIFRVKQCCRNLSSK